MDLSERVPKQNCLTHVPARISFQYHSQSFKAEFPKLFSMRETLNNRPYPEEPLPINPNKQIYIHEEAVVTAHKYSVQNVPRSKHTPSQL
jgi:hypothetical protein